MKQCFLQKLRFSLVYYFIQEEIRNSCICVKESVGNLELLELRVISQLGMSYTLQLGMICP